MKKQIISARVKLQAETERLDALDVESCRKEFDKAVSELMERYGCRILIQGRFIGDQIKTEVVIVKAK